MSVQIGMVQTFADVKADRGQALKIVEESAEVFSAIEDIENCSRQSADSCNAWACYESCAYRNEAVNEIADVIQACANMLTALGVDDMTAAMDACKAKNQERGRRYVKAICDKPNWDYCETCERLEMYEHINSNQKGTIADMREELELASVKLAQSKETNKTIRKQNKKYRAQLRKLNDNCELWRGKCGAMLDVAQEIQRIGDITNDEPMF